MPITQDAAAKSNRPMPVGEASGNVVREQDPQEEEEGSQPTDKAVRAAPPWLVSMVIHMVLFIILAICTLPFLGQRERVLEVLPTYAEELGEQLEDDQLQTLQLDPALTDPVLSEDTLPVEDPFAAPPEITEIVFDATSSTSDIAAPNIGLALTGREKGMKKALLGAYGGTATTEAAAVLVTSCMSPCNIGDVISDNSIAAAVVCVASHVYWSRRRTRFCQYPETGSWRAAPHDCTGS